MPLPISEHAFISNSRGAALVDKRGNIDWLCLPRFDSPACFAALLGTEEHGCWSIVPIGKLRSTEQRYRDHTLVVDSEMETASGRVQVSDCMPIDRDCAEVVRVVHGLSGRVRMRMLFRPRFGYGAKMPTLTSRASGFVAASDEGTAALNASIALREHKGDMVAEFEVAEGERITFAMTYSNDEVPAEPSVDPEAALESCERWWREWAGRCEYEGPWRETVMRSLLTLKGLIYAPTGGIVAAATTSLPEVPGGVRNWDYRYCWLRDATFTLLALLGNGYRDEAKSWRDWLVDSVRHDPFTMHVLYRVDGSPDVPERELPWLPGYRGSRPVRVGNGAVAQFQIDTRGEVMDVLHVARENGLEAWDDAWDLQKALLEELEGRWREPDHGIWEMRGDAAHFVHSKALAWVAFDRGIAAARYAHVDGPIDHWCAVRDGIREDIMRNGFDRRRGVFLQRYGAPDLDASLLLLPLVGFIEPDSPEAIATTDAIRSELSQDGLLLRYKHGLRVDGLPGHEGTFLPCSFWLVDNLALSGRIEDAEELFGRLIGLCNHVGLMSEEWHHERGEMLGNVPQGLSHVGLLNSARILAHVRDSGRHSPDVRKRGDPTAYCTQGHSRSQRDDRARQPASSMTEDSK